MRPNIKIWRLDLKLCLARMGTQSENSKDGFAWYYKMSNLSRSCFSSLCSIETHHSSWFPFRDQLVLFGPEKAITIELRLVPHESSIVFNLISFLGWATYNEHDQRAANSRTVIVAGVFSAQEASAWMVFNLVVFHQKVLLHQMFW